MRICLFTPTFFPVMGGVEVWCDMVARGLMGRGHEVVVLAQRMKSPLKMPELPYTVERFTRPPKQHLWAEILAWPLLRAHKRHRFDVVMTVYGYPLGYATSVVKYRMGAGHVAVAHGNDLYDKFQRQRKFRLLRVTRLGYQRANHVVCVSETMARRCRELLSQEAKPEAFPPITVIRNGIDMPAWRKELGSARVEVPGIVREFNLEPGKFSLQVAGFRSVKRHDLAIQAVAKLQPLFRAQGLRHVMLGVGKLLDDSRQMARQMGIEDLILFPGVRTGAEKMWLFGQASFLVNTSDEEGLPFVLIESAGSALPLLVSDIHPHTDFIAGSACGRAFNQGDADALTAAWSDMITSDLALMRTAAAEHAAHYDSGKMLDAYESICESIRGKPGS